MAGGGGGPPMRAAVLGNCGHGGAVFGAAGKGKGLTWPSGPLGPFRLATTTCQPSPPPLTTIAPAPRGPARPLPAGDDDVPAEPPAEIGDGARVLVDAAHVDRLEQLAAVGSVEQAELALAADGDVVDAVAVEIADNRRGQQLGRHGG